MARPIRQSVGAPLITGHHSEVEGKPVDVDLYVLRSTTGQCVLRPSWAPFWFHSSYSLLFAGSIIAGICYLAWNRPIPGIGVAASGLPAQYVVLAFTGGIVVFVMLAFARRCRETIQRGPLIILDREQAQLVLPRQGQAFAWEEVLEVRAKKLQWRSATARGGRRGRRYWVQIEILVRHGGLSEPGCAIVVGTVEGLGIGFVRRIRKLAKECHAQFCVVKKLELS